MTFAIPKSETIHWPSSEKKTRADALVLFFGRGRIRTHGPRKGTPVFKTGAIGHSATLPKEILELL